MKEFEEKIKYANAFNQLERIGPKNFEKIDHFFDSLKQAWQAPTTDFKQAGIKGEKTLSQLAKKRSKVDPEKALRPFKRGGVKVLLRDFAQYPSLLKQIPDPPFILYVKGSLKAIKNKSIAVVGTRSFSNYGKEVTPYLTRKIAHQGFTVVSGLAKGIDTFAHKTCVEEGTPTVAVMATGLEKVYPRSNSKLAKKIIKSGGAIVTENPVGTSIKRYLFPLRNRIISGLSLGTLVVEAAEKSGALITANQALEQNREVFAVPGGIFSTPSKGTNNLIKKGAKPVTDVGDILEELDLEKYIGEGQEKKIVPADKNQERILEALQQGGLHIDKIIKKTGLDSQVVSSTLTTMAIKDKVKELGGGVYGLKR